MKKLDLYKIFTTGLPLEPSVENTIYFQHLTMDGLEEMHAYSKNERLYEFFEFPPFSNINETKAYLKKLFNRMSSDGSPPNSNYWFVRRTSDNRLIGTACLVNLDLNRKSVEIGYGIDPELWGNGYILKIQEALKKFVFKDLKLNRLWGITMISNRRTIESVKASGFSNEGLIKEYYCADGHFIDGWQYSMTSSQYDLETPSISFLSPEVSLNEIIAVVASVIDDQTIEQDGSMETISSWDSLSHMEIILALQENFKIKFSPSEIAKVTSIKFIYEIMKNKELSN